MIEQPHIVIVGGGIAGLSSAWYLQQRATTPLKITILEQSTHVGGKVRTDIVSIQDSAEPLVIEGGPDSFILQKPWAAQLCRELGLEDQFIATQSYKHNVYVLHRGRPLPLPDGIRLMVPTNIRTFLVSPLISWPGKVRMGLDFILPARRSTGDETLGAFVRRRFGREALDKIAEPLMAGIFNAESERQSLQATFPRFLEIEQQHGSIIRGMIKAQAAHKQPTNTPTSPFRALRGGMQTLIDTLRTKLNADIRTESDVRGLTRHEQGYTLALRDGTALEADAVVLAIPSYTTADLVDPWARNLADELRQIRYVSTGTMTLAYHRTDIDLQLEGYGLVIPNSEKRRINACTISSRKFDHRAPADYVLIRIFFGGSRHPEIFAMDDERLGDIIRAELRDIFGISAEPVWSGIYRWPGANPQYDVDHLKRVDRIEAACPEGLYLTGSAYRGVGLPDCIHQGQQTAERVLASLVQQELAQAN